MNPLTFIYHEILFRPLFNLLVAITNFLPNHSIGIAIILVTIIVRLVLLPSSLHQARLQQKNQAKLAGLQKELKAIHEEHKNDKAKRAEETMALYRKSGVNPASGCLPLLIQLPILLALYRVFLSGLKAETFRNLYSFVAVPTQLQSTFFGLDLSMPSIYLGVLAGVAQFIQMRFFNPSPAMQPGMDQSSEQMMASMQKNMMYVFPVMTVFISLQLPAALALYWFVSTVLALGQQYMIKKALKLNSAPVTV